MPNPVSKLLRTGDVEFDRIAGADIRQQAPPHFHRALRHPAVVGRYYAHLVAFNRRVELDLSTKRDEIQRMEDDETVPPEELAEAVLAHHVWRTRALKFKAGLEGTIAQVKAIRDDEINRLRERIAALEAGIEAHRDAMTGLPLRNADRPLYLLATEGDVVDNEVMA